MTGLWLVSYIVLWALVVALAILLLSISRLVGRINHRVFPGGALVTDSGPEFGASVIPETSRWSARHPILQFPRARDLLLIFVSPTCPACTLLLKRLSNYARHVSSDADIAVINTSGDPSGHSSLVSALNTTAIPIVALPKLAEELSITGTPYALWLSGEGILMAKGVINQLDHIESLRNASRSGYPSFERSQDLKFENARAMTAREGKNS
jgi:methylamine dehydrogenase accessory protein MauD